MAVVQTQTTPTEAPAGTPKTAPTVTAEQIAIVKATAPVLKDHGVAITTLFYKNLIDDNPPLKNMFNLTAQTTGAQPRALANAVLAYATYIDEPQFLKHAIERIAHKHASLQVEPAMYDLVGQYLIQAIGIVLGAAATPAIVDAWTAAYSVLADIFINREKVLYSEARSRDDIRGWVGWRKFRVARREAADDARNIVSLYLEPVDGVPLPSYRPGQYVSLQLFVPGLNLLQSRQYSLSKVFDSQGSHYRISVKRDNGRENTPRGIVSNMVHALNEDDEVELSQPQGEFVVEDNGSLEEQPPLVLLSAGVGATAVFPILQQAAEDGQPASWLHGSHSLAAVPFEKGVQAIKAAHPDQVETQLFLTNAEPSAHASMTISRLEIASLTPADQTRLLRTDNTRTGYYICGPASFMLESRTALSELGVAPDRIHLELFATGDL
ncbi:oxidoreductase-like protein [Ophiostoma piceae UAMH 11346]|uniref:nitric oxide dioxygenase n=1 Tax=Ophiostoma piceae (strain UAMH 11346) TaxID=1262450 RepID=S3C729_OPHP1|nr:oxidoreductase-like protein [Ophiostoma piceae UAMH 11346]